MKKGTKKKRTVRVTSSVSDLRKYVRGLTKERRVPKRNKKEKEKLVKLKPAMFRVFIGSRQPFELFMQGQDRARERHVVATTADRAMRKVRLNKKKGEYYAGVFVVARSD